MALGIRPEREPERIGWLDAKARSFATPRIRRLAEARMRRVPRLVKALDGPLQRGSDMDLSGVAETLRARLGLEGLTERLVVRSFALVREVARRKLGTPHYDVQLMGGWLMTQGMLAEMQTGEGKTLTATLPACTAALAGIPVHVVSSNDYLVARDADLMRPIYEGLGLTVGYVTEGIRDPEARRAAYACDVTYGTAKMFAFDYLRDRITMGGLRGLARRLDELEADDDGSHGLLLRGLCYAVVDEADSVLIDEARTPLILSRPGDPGDQKKLYTRALRLARSLSSGTDFELDRARGRLDLTDPGRERLAGLTEPLGGVFQGPRRREELVTRALCALHLYQRDRHYIVRDDAIQIVDALTGRVSPDRAWEGGLHQLVELKEGCTLTAQNETLARISYQQFFRRYLRLSGMTGTAQEVAAELAGSYELHPVVVPTRKPLRREDQGERLFVNEEDKWQAVVSRVRELRRLGRPTLIGTWSVEASEALGERLAAADVPHRVLNARQDAEEAAIVAGAGEAGPDTVAPSMAGRGTDIQVTPRVEAAGGLHVIATQRAEARRIDRQLQGRSGRQGDRGSFELIASLEDLPQRTHFPGSILAFARALARDGVVPGRLASVLLSRPQTAEERRHAAARQRLVHLEEYLDSALAFSGVRE